MERTVPAGEQTSDLQGTSGQRPPHRRRIRVGRPARPARERRRMGARDSYLLAAVTLFLVAFGLVMVLSASSAELAGDGSNPYADFITQSAAAAIGILGMILASRVRPAAWTRVGVWVFAIGVGLQVLVISTGLGRGAGGNTNWLAIGTVQFQPSEFVKLGLVLMVATFFSRKDGATMRWRQLSGVLLLGAIAMTPVMLGKDMGTTLILAGMLVAGMFFADVRLRMFVLPLLALGLGAAVLVLERPSRVERFGAWLQGCSTSGTDTLGTCWQSIQGTWALAAGGVTGVGIGNSVSKWFWLPEADNDFIVAVIGEETGLIGLVILLGLFVALAVAFVRISGSTSDPFTRVATGMLLTWIVGQAFVNVAVVLGFLPVLGVPLPFVSKGGSSMVASLVAVGCVMSLANAARTDRAAAVFETPLPPPDDAAARVARAHPDHPSVGRARSAR